MSEPSHLKCSCLNCGQSIEYPAEGTGQTVPCPACEKPVLLTPAIPPVISAPPFQEKPKTQKLGRSNLSKLTEETIRAKTKAGDTPLHRAAKNGQFDLILPQLLTIDLFMVRNSDGNTPLHVAARQGTLNQVPRQFLTRDTLTVRATPHYAPDGFYLTGSGYKALTETPLHIAALYGHGNLIAEEFLTPEFLSIEAKGHGQSVLHYFAMSKSLDCIPDNLANSKIWELKDRQGMTAQDIQKSMVEQDKYVAQKRNESATEKQKTKLRYFGYAIKEGMTKGEASDAIDNCVRDFPEIERAYQNRPATTEQLEQIQKLNEESLRIDGEERYDIATLTYEKVKDIIQEDLWQQKIQENEEFEEEMKVYSNPPTKEQLAVLKESGIGINLSAGITEADLRDLLKLEGQPPRDRDSDIFALHGLTSVTGDAFAAYALADLIMCFGGSLYAQNRADVDYVAACQIASRDPAYLKPTLSKELHWIVFTWPKIKIREWLRPAK